MKRFLKYLACTAALAIAGVAAASTTWSTAPMAPKSYNTARGTSTTPDEGAPTSASDGFDVEPGKPYLLTVKASYPTQYSYTSFGVRTNDGGILCQSGDASCEAPTVVSGYVGDGGCVLESFDGGCLYPQPTTPNDAGAIVGPRTSFGAGELRAYLYNPGSKTWSRAPAFDVFVSAGGTEEAFSVTSPPAPVGRIAYSPIGFQVPPQTYLTALSR